MASAGRYCPVDLDKPAAGAAEEIAVACGRPGTARRTAALWAVRRRPCRPRSASWSGVVSLPWLAPNRHAGVGLGPAASRRWTLRVRPHRWMLVLEGSVGEASHEGARSREGARE